MALVRVIKAEGVVEVSGFKDATLNVNFEYNSGTPPTNIHFTVGMPDGTWVDGNYSGDKIQNYNVNNGIVIDELMQAVQGVLANISENYETA